MHNMPTHARTQATVSLALHHTKPAIIDPLCPHLHSQTSHHRQTHLLLLLMTLCTSLPCTNNRLISNNNNISMAAAMQQKKALEIS